MPKLLLKKVHKSINLASPALNYGPGPQRKALLKQGVKGKMSKKFSKTAIHSSLKTGEYR